MGKLRSVGVLLIVYLDDILIIAKSKSACKRSTDLTVKLLTELGFLINHEKSNLIPTQETKFLGFMYNTIEMKTFLSTDKVTVIKKLISKTTTNPYLKIRRFA